MNIELRLKYRIQEGIRGYKAKPRTGNSSGIEKKKKKTGRGDLARPKFMRVEGLTGKSRMEYDAS